MISTGKSSGYLNRCSEVAESFSDTFDQNLRSGGSSGIWSKPSERFNLQANGNCVKRICELPVNKLGTLTPDWELPTLRIQAQNVRSRLRYWMASAMCL